MNKKVFKTAIILAAGFSSRMGMFKPLLPLGESSILEHQLDTMKQIPLDFIAVVTGYRSQLLLPILDKKSVQAVYNENYSKGMFTSVKAGLKAVTEKNKGLGEACCFLSLVDCPLVPASIYQAMLEKYDCSKPAFIVPRFRGKKGHPLLIPSIYYDEILSYSGEGGLKHITDKYRDNMMFLDVNDESVVLDMDTQGDYLDILEYYEDRISSKAQDETSYKRKRRLFLIRHGETRQHKDKIFMGQVDIPLNSKGRKKAEEIAEKLLNELPSTDVIYTSDLSRAQETALIISEELKKVKPFKLVTEPDFREISLGPWDGMFISEVREKFPEQYIKRGEDLLSYKFGNECENFYDLQYRVMKRINRILKETEGDIVLVAHSGVIRILQCNFSGKNLENIFNLSVPKGSLTIIDI